MLKNAEKSKNSNYHRIRSKCRMNVAYPSKWQPRVKFFDPQFFVGMRTSGTPEISTNQPYDKILEILLWYGFGARRAVWRTVSQIFLGASKLWLLSFILVGTASSYDTCFVLYIFWKIHDFKILKFFNFEHFVARASKCSKF